jgi:Arc/MetJ family transcription regulator
MLIFLLKNLEDKMRTTLDLDEKLLREAIKVTGIKNKTKLLNKSLKDEIKFKKKQNFLNLRNSGIIDDDFDVLKLREAELNEK